MIYLKYNIKIEEIKMIVRQNQNTFKKISILIILTMLISLISFKPLDVKAAAGSNTLYMGERLNTGERITSSNGAYFAIMQSDGNFVLYTSSGQVLWHTGTFGGNYSSYIANMQMDGNFVVYGYNGSYTPLWNTQTFSSCYLRLDDDSVLRLYYTGGGIYKTVSSNSPISTPTGWSYMFHSPQIATKISQAYSSSHYGIDIVHAISGVVEGYPVYATGNGTVKVATKSTSAGNYVVIVLDNGYTARYLHLKNLPEVSVNQRVTYNSRLGLVYEPLRIAYAECLKELEQLG